MRRREARTQKDRTVERRKERDDKACEKEIRLEYKQHLSTETVEEYGVWVDGWMMDNGSKVGR